MQLGSNNEQTKSHNRKVILETIRLHEPISRAEIARHTELTAQTVANIVTELLEQGIVTTKGRRQGQRGQPAIELEFNPDGAFSVGLHLDRDHLTGVLVNLRGAPQQRTHHARSFDRPEEAYPFMRQVVEDLLATVPRERVWGVGLALPGPIHSRLERGIEVSSVQRWVRGPVRDLLAGELQLPVYVENDATAAALGEYWYASDRSVRDFFYIYFGFGLGGGIIHEGQPYTGFAGNAAEIGHIPIQPYGPECSCGGRGCLELYVSFNALMETLRKNNLEPTDSAALEALFLQHEPSLIGWLEQAAYHLAPALVSLENLFDPETIVLGGRLPRAITEALIQKANMHVPTLRMKAKEYRPKVVCAQVGEDAAALGAATLPIFETLAPHTGRPFKVILERKLLAGEERG